MLWEIAETWGLTWGSLRLSSSLSHFALLTTQGSHCATPFAQVKQLYAIHSSHTCFKMYGTWKYGYQIYDSACLGRESNT